MAQTISIEALTATVLEGGVLEYRLTRTGDVADGLTVYVGSAGSGSDSATNGADFFQPFTSYFQPGQTSLTVKMPAFRDGISEATERTTLQVLPGLGSQSGDYEIGTEFASFSIEDRPPAVVSIVANGATAGQEGTEFSFTLTRTGGDASQSLFVSLASSGTANFSDISFPTFIGFDPGQTSRTITVRSMVDNAVETPPETLTLTVVPNTHYVSAASPANAVTYTIEDLIPPVVSIAVAEANTLEGAFGSSKFATFTLTLSKAVPYSLSVVATVGGGTASPGSDYFNFTQSVFFSPNQTTATLTVPINGDGTVEGDETFTVTLSSPSSFGFGPAPTISTSAGTVTQTITNDDAPSVITVEALDGFGREGNDTNMAFLLTRTGDLSQSLTVAVGTSPLGPDGASFGTGAGADYNSSGAFGTVFFAPDRATAIVNLLVTDDASAPVAEPVEQFTFSILADPNAVDQYVASSTANSAIGTIFDNESDQPIVAQTISITAGGAAGQPPASGVEGSVLSYTLTRTGSNTADLTVYLSVSASAGGQPFGGEYFAPQTAHFLPGQTSINVKVPTFRDTMPESSESLIVTIQPTILYTVDANAASATLTLQDFALPVLAFTPVTTSAKEGGSLEFTLSRSGGDLASSLSAFLTVTNGSASGSDYGPPFLVTFAPGETSKAVRFPAFLDTNVEADETFTIRLGTSSNYAIAAGSTADTTFTIVPETAPVANLSVAATVAEGTNGPAQLLNVTVTLDHAVNYQTSVFVSPTGGTATNGTDFSGLVPTVFFEPGATSKTVTIPIFGDGYAEPNETFSIAITGTSTTSGPPPVIGSSASATVTILNDDPAPTVSVQAIDAFVQEGRSGDVVTFLFTRTGDLGPSLLVPISIMANPAGAIPGQDFFGTSPFVFFAAGSSTAVLTLSANDDFSIEAAETFAVTILPNERYIVGAASATATVLDNNDVSVFDLWSTPEPVGAEDQTFLRPQGAVFGGDNVWSFLTTPVAGFDPIGDNLVTIQLRAQDRFGSYDETPTTLATANLSASLGGVGGLLFTQPTFGTYAGGAFWFEKSGTTHDLKYQAYTSAALASAQPGPATTLTGSVLELASDLANVTSYSFNNTGSSFVVAWETRAPGDTTRDVFFRAFDAAGTALGPVAQVGTDLSDGVPWGVFTTTFGSYKYAQEGVNASGATLRFSDFNPATGALGSAVEVSTSLDDITGLSGRVINFGSSALIMAAGTDDGVGKIAFVLTDSNFVPTGAGPAFTVTLAGAHAPGRVQSVGVPGGEALFAYSDLNDDTVHVVRTNASGQLVQNFTVPDLTGFDQIRSLSDGRFEIAWRDGAAGTENAVRTRIYDLRSNPLNATFGGNADAIAGTIFNDVVDGGAGADVIEGAIGADRLIGSLGNDTLRGGAGADTLFGGDGDDSMSGGADADSATFRGSRAQYSVTILQDGRIQVVDNVAARDGSDILDRVETGLFADGTFALDTNTAPIATADTAFISRGATATLAAGLLLQNDADAEGQTLTIASVGGATAGSSVSLSGGQVIFTATSATAPATAGFTYTATDGAGNATAAVTINLVTTSAGADIRTVATAAGQGSWIDGLGGADKLTGGAGLDTLLGGAGADRLAGGDGQDRLFGGADNDTLEGGTGLDAMFGGLGNDTYTVDDAGDTVREDTVAGVDDGGVDVVNASVSFTLGAFVENLKLTAAGLIDGTGNEGANRIEGFTGNNVLSGLGGADSLLGGGGDDTLLGGAGIDTLTGGAGTDRLDGGEEGDTYVVDLFDTVLDTGAGGRDKVIVGTGYTLSDASGIEDLQQQNPVTPPPAGSTTTLVGNGLANVIVGNGYDNRVRGLGGDDSLQGGAGADTLEGGAGVDSLRGDAGADVFFFQTADSPASLTTFDTILDFTSADDTVDLVLGAASLAVGAYGEVALNSNTFSALQTRAETEMAAGKKVVFVAGSAHGWLFWNADADAAAEGAVRLFQKTSLAAFEHADLM